MFVKQMQSLKYINSLFSVLLILWGHLLQPALANTQLLAQNADPSDYRIIVTNKAITLETEINELAKQGYRMIGLSKAIVGVNFAALLSRPLKNQPPTLYEYKVLSANRIETISTELEEAAKKGAEFRGITAANRLIYLGEYLVIVEWVKGNQQPRFEYQILYN